MTILVTGGAGYIGSHFVRHLERKNIDFIIADNFSTGHKKFVKDKKFYKIDLKDPEEIRLNLQDLDITSIVHFAGLSIVSDSQKMEKKYYENNVIASMNLARFALERKIKKIRGSLEKPPSIMMLRTLINYLRWLMANLL